MSQRNTFNVRWSAKFLLWKDIKEIHLSDPKTWPKKRKENGERCTYSHYALYFFKKNLNRFERLHYVVFCVLNDLPKEVFLQHGCLFKEHHATNVLV